MNRKLGIFFAALIVAIGGIIYELMISTAATYLFGNSVLQFSITIGTMLFAMGIGSLIAPQLKSSAEQQFILVESLLAIIGGYSVAILFFVYSYTQWYYYIYLLLLIMIGILIGLEIPLMLKIVSDKKRMITITSRILSLDYFGALIASIAYPLLLLPYLGILRTAFLVGLLNCAIAVLMYISFRKNITHKLTIGIWLFIVSLLLTLGLIFTNTIANKTNQKLYQDEIVFSSQSKYQKIIITKFNNDIRLYLDGNIQFSSIDEYRYHEPLVHIPLSNTPNLNRIAILGGGDGLAIREVLKYHNVEEIILIELDPAMTEIATENKLITNLNNQSLSNKKVTVINKDAFSFLEKNSQLFNAIIIDLPDPNNESLAKLYSREFYRLVYRNLTEDGVMVTQATSPYFSKNTFWMIERTITSELFYTYPYHSYVPSFGEWGFVMATKTNISDKSITLPENMKLNFLHSKEQILNLFEFPSDMNNKNIDNDQINTLIRPIILDTYNKDYNQWQ